MATQHHVRQFLAADDTDDVLNGRVEIDRAVHQVSALAEAGQGRRIDLMPGLAQQSRYPLVAPPAMPSAMDENEGSHGRPPAIGHVGATYNSGTSLSSAPDPTAGACLERPAAQQLPGEAHVVGSGRDGASTAAIEL